MYVVKHKDNRPFMQREVGVADGLSRDYVWGKGNGHEQAMPNVDAERLMRTENAAEFEFVKAGDDAADEAE